MNTALFSCKNSLKLKEVGVDIFLSYKMIMKLSLLFDNTETIPWKVNVNMAQSKDRLSMDLTTKLVNVRWSRSSVQISPPCSLQGGNSLRGNPCNSPRDECSLETTSKPALNYYIVSKNDVNSE